KHLRRLQTLHAIMITDNYSCCYQKIRGESQYCNQLFHFKPKLVVKAGFKKRKYHEFVRTALINKSPPDAYPDLESWQRIIFSHKIIICKAHTSTRLLPDRIQVFSPYKSLERANSKMDIGGYIW